MNDIQPDKKGLTVFFDNVKNPDFWARSVNHPIFILTCYYLEIDT